MKSGFEKVCPVASQCLVIYYNTFISFWVAGSHVAERVVWVEEFFLFDKLRNSSEEREIIVGISFGL